MNQIKGVSVTTPRNPSDPQLHPDGEDFIVHEAGHLLVVTHGNRRVAAYAPGNWTSVRLVTEG